MVAGGLDLRGMKEIAVPLDVPGYVRGQSICVIWPSVRPDVCGRGDLHRAEAFIRFSCGCPYTYCRHALVILYGRVNLRWGRCPKHDDEVREIIEANWIRP